MYDKKTLFLVSTIIFKENCINGIHQEGSRTLSWLFYFMCNMRETERGLYAFFDDENAPKEKKVFKDTTWREANKLNEEGFGIYWSVNTFDGARRKENLKKFLGWYVEFDDGNKESQAKRIREFTKPSLIIESKRGFQTYYFAKEETGIENYDDIMINHLIPNLNSDKAVRDLSRVLRAPNFYHLKDPKNPFLCEIVYMSKKTYSEKEMMNLFPPKNQRTIDTIVHTNYLKNDFKSFTNDSSLWARVYEMDSMQSLIRLSGSDAVNGEVYDFKPTGRNRFNIIVNGKITGCFIDEFGRIGSKSGGGTSPYNWIKWIQGDSKKAFNYMKEMFPEIFIGER